MESNNKRIKLKITVVTILKNQNFSPFEDGFSTILLDNMTPPSIMIEELPNGGVLSLAKDLLSNYVKFDTSFLNANNIDIFQGQDCLEIIFCFNLVYIPGSISNGSLFSRKDLSDRKIELDGRYGKYI